MMPPTMPSPPPGFRLEQSGPCLLVARDDLRAAAHALGLLSPGGLERVFERAEPAAAGRTMTFVLPWPGGGPRVLLRRLLHGGWLGGVLGDRFTSPARPLRELAHTYALRQAGAPLPEPLLVVGERRRGMWRLAFATRFEANTCNALDWLRATPDAGALQAVSQAAGRSIRKLHDAGCRHADLHLGNLLLREQPGGFEVIVIDLDLARIRPALTPAERMAQLMRIYRSALKHGLQGDIGTHNMMRFLDGYCGEDYTLRHAMLRHLHPELRRVALHRLGYRRAPPAGGAGAPRQP